jgi:hypothetical protein
MKLTDILAEATEVKHTANTTDPTRNWGFPIPPTLQPELGMQGRLGRPFNFSGSWGAPGIRPGKDHSDFRGHFRTKKHWNLPKLMRSESMTSGSLAVPHCIDHLYLYLQWWCVWTHSLPRDTNRSNGRQSSKLLRRCVLFPLIFFSHGLKSTSAAPVLSQDFPENVGI